MLRIFRLWSSITSLLPSITSLGPSWPPGHLSGALPEDVPDLALDARPHLQLGVFPGYTVEVIPGKGLGLVANRDFAVGEVTWVNFIVDSGHWTDAP